MGLFLHDMSFYLTYIEIKIIKPITLRGSHIAWLYFNIIYIKIKFIMDTKSDLNHLELPLIDVFALVNPNMSSNEKLMCAK